MSQVVQRQTNPMSVWLVFSGVVLGVVGASLRKHAESVGEVILALCIRVDISEVATVLMPSHWWIGMLIAGAVVLLSGFMAIAARQSRGVKANSEEGMK